MGTRTEVGTGREREQGRRWRPVDERRMGTGTGAGMETRAVADVGTGTRMGMGTGAGTRTGLGGEGGREAKNYKKMHKSCRRHVGNGGDLGGKRKKR